MSEGGNMADGTDPRPEAGAERPDPSRRAFLIGAAGVGVAAGGLASAAILLARGGAQGPVAPSTGSPSASRTATPATTTVAQLLAERPFRIAHRGGSDDWPEMSAFA